MDDTMSERVVVPEKRRKGILKMAHSNKLGGLFSYKKTAATMPRCLHGPVFLKKPRPGVDHAQNAKRQLKKTSHLAALCPLPVISTPFSRMAFDLVVPLPKSKSGNRYILTCLCLASKYPEAAPLRRGYTYMYVPCI